MTWSSFLAFCRRNAMSVVILPSNMSSQMTPTSSVSISFSTNFLAYGLLRKNLSNCRALYVAPETSMPRPDSRKYFCLVGPRALRSDAASTSDSMGTRPLRPAIGSPAFITVSIASPVRAAVRPYAPSFRPLLMYLLGSGKIMLNSASMIPEP